MIWPMKTHFKGVYYRFMMTGKQ